MENAENKALSLKDEDVDITHPYYNAKEMLEQGEEMPTKRPLEFNENDPVTPVVPPKRIVLSQNSHFSDNFVNTSLSAVHVPTNVFDRGECLTM